MPDRDMQLSFRYGTIGTLIPVVTEDSFTLFFGIFRQQSPAATTTTKVTSLTHEEIRTESNDHLSIQLKPTRDAPFRAMPLQTFHCARGHVVTLDRHLR